jgi:hypothetical protein
MPGCVVSRIQGSRGGMSPNHIDFKRPEQSNLIL